MGEGALYIQSDWTVLLDSAHSGAASIRDALARFAELVKAPDRFQTYRITPVTLWGAAGQGWTADEVCGFLAGNSANLPGENMLSGLRECMSRYGKWTIMREGDTLLLDASDNNLMDAWLKNSRWAEQLVKRSDGKMEMPEALRGAIKQELFQQGHPVVDTAGFHHGEALEIRLRDPESSGFSLRPYQQDAATAFCREGERQAGSGVIVMPCGSGKTVVGIAAMAQLGCATLVLTPNVSSLRQWKREICEKTGIASDQIGEYSGERKEVRPITLATYQILTHRGSAEQPFRHMRLFAERDWGLVIYDEVHLLPAPVFRATADIQATRRLGLTATLIREDGCEGDVFALIGPKLYELPWRQLEANNWIAQVEAAEYRIPLPDSIEGRYRAALPRERYRIAAENAGKLEWVARLLNKHRGKGALVIGHYLGQLREASRRLQAPLITGNTPHDERERLYEQFRRGETKVLIVSKVANFAIDLPQASLAIQLSGSYGSRQEEAQRLGRVLRPKLGDNRAYFYTLVSGGTVEEDFSRNRRLFLLEQGYEYRIETADLVAADDAVGEDLVQF
ncbi:DNA repair helicase XPB [Gorillibacterium massiliense]|uniref:DNA repair helicase XPB n=1 Tax=Gorillibacterium massiliense TaxID=1280390 RepID=UPI0004B9CA5E|nr:DNA repair helicase XPB [Gorillibacterium massiliense]